MPSKLKYKITIDILMTITLIILMGYIFTMDLTHEIIGTIMIVLWIIHNILNWRWYKSILKTKNTLKKILITSLNILLLISIIGLIISSIILSSYVFSFLNIDKGINFARVLHMVSSYWCFILSALHLGLHVNTIINVINKNSNFFLNKKIKLIFKTLFLILSIFGIYAFYKHNLISYMFLRVQFVFFDFEQSLSSFLFDYVSMIILFSSIAYYLNLNTKKKTKEKINE
ncbi:MAG: DUF4405 domain-containing protein [Pleomorphochaeta sp.]